MRTIIINYDAGNILSVQNMIKKVGFRAEISQDKHTIEQADKLILPGVGHFDYGARQLHALGLWDILQEKVLHQKKLILGICLGAQMMTQSSEEGTEKGLGWIQGKTVRFKAENQSMKIPHMGWNNVKFGQKDHVLLKDLENEQARFYFVHKYHFQDVPKDAILTTTQYGYEFTSGFAQDNIMGVQFHPEKSHKFGMTMLKNFMQL